MKIYLNGKEEKIEVKSLEELCTSLGFKDAKVATAVNGDFIPKHQRSNCTLSPNDKVEVVSPRQGG